jgi:hypothetical protein
VCATGAHQVASAQVTDRPQPLGVALDLLDLGAEVKLGAAAAQEEVIELEPPDEPAVAGNRVILAAKMDVAGVPLPDPARVRGGRELEHVPDRRRHPATA